MLDLTKKIKKNQSFKCICKHTEFWKYEESLLNPFYRFYVTTHMCSYICWCVYE